ncbi:hypothetical protein HDV05_001828, partial [Chytridiales sp. JEL 0842]
MTDPPLLCIPCSNVTPQPQPPSRRLWTTGFTSFQQDPARHAATSAQGAQASNEVQFKQEVRALCGEGRVYKLSATGGSNIWKGKQGAGYNFSVLNENISISKENVNEAFVGALEIRIKVGLLPGYSSEQSYLTLREEHQGE